jgi:hypothetical protein
MATTYQVKTHAFLAIQPSGLSCWHGQANSLHHQKVLGLHLFWLCITYSTGAGSSSQGEGKGGWEGLGWGPARLKARKDEKGRPHMEFFFL